MDLKSKKNASIYIQIAESICDRILRGEFKPLEKIISIREMAVLLEVNPNTVQRSYEWLQQKEIIYTQRGKGYFVNENAKEIVMDFRKQKFIDEVLPDVFKNMELLQLNILDIEKKYQTYLKKQKQ